MLFEHSLCAGNCTQAAAGVVQQIWSNAVGAMALTLLLVYAVQVPS